MLMMMNAYDMEEKPTGGGKNFQCAKNRNHVKNPTSAMNTHKYTS
jgi:hypothetical protein